jgi:hypothetical protein
MIEMGDPLVIMGERDRPDGEMLLGTAIALLREAADLPEGRALERERKKSEAWGILHALGWNAAVDLKEEDKGCETCAEYRWNTPWKRCAEGHLTEDEPIKKDCPDHVSYRPSGTTCNCKGCGSMITCPPMRCPFCGVHQ